MIGGRLSAYEVLSELGSGGMGTVYLGTCAEAAAGLDEGTKVALKVIHPHLVSEAGFFKRFLREAQVGQEVQHENVVRTYDCDATLVDGQQQNFLVMEYVEGQTLRDLLDELERVPEELCRHIGREVARGLAAIHEAGVVHRDIKPENVLITDDHVVKVMDLGIARLQDEVMHLSQTGAFVGSLQYAAPECFRGGGKDVDGRSDLHALGLVLYELACGVNPYVADDVPQTIHKVLHEEPRRLGDRSPQLSPFFEEVVHTLLAKDRSERLLTAGELAGVLAEGEEAAWWTDRATAIRSLTRRPLRRIRVPRETAVYGREDELAALRGLYEEVKAGAGRVVLLQGEAGIGKSRLVDHLVSHLEADGEDVNFLFGSYPPGGAATASGGFSMAYREQFGAAGCAAHLSATPALAPAFDALLRGEPTPPDQARLAQESIQTCFVNATRSLAGERPTIVVIDDLHFAPDEGRSLFSALALGITDDNVLLIGTMRPGVSEEWLAGLTRLERTRTLELQRLGPKHLVRLLQDSLRSDRLAQELSSQIALKSDGNPFFVFEILRGLREQQFITRSDDGTWSTTRIIEEIEIPSSVLDLVKARVADLSEQERDLLDVAACWGYEFDPGLIGDVFGLGRIPVLKRFGQIERAHRLVRAAGRNYVFDHHQVQEALYGSLHEQLREEYHASLAEVLEARAGGATAPLETVDGTLCVDLCRHFLLGGRNRSAHRYLSGAQAHLEAGYLHAEAATLTERALAAPDLLTGGERIEALLFVAAPPPLAGDRQEKAARRAVQLAEEMGDEVLEMKAVHTLGRVLYHTRRGPELEGLWQRARDLAQALGDRAMEARLTGNLGLLLQDAGRLEESRAHHERDLALSREIGDAVGEARAMGNLGNVCRPIGLLDEAERCIRRQLEISRDLGDLGTQARALGNLGLTLQRAGRLAEARERLEESLAITTQVGNRRSEAIGIGNLVGILWIEGRTDEAREHLERQLALAVEIGDVHSEMTATGNLGVIATSQGRPLEGLDLLERQIALCREMGDRRVEAMSLGNLGILVRERGQVAKARKVFERAIATSREHGERRSAAIALLNLGITGRDEGGPPDAGEGSLLGCLAITAQHGFPDVAVFAQNCLGSLRAARSGGKEGKDDLVAARDEATELGDPVTATLARCELAALPDGDSDDALAAFAEHESSLSANGRREARFLLWKATGDRTHLEAAHRLVDEALSHFPVEDHEAIRTNVWINRDIMKAWEDHKAADT